MSLVSRNISKLVTILTLAVCASSSSLYGSNPPEATPALWIIHKTWQFRFVDPGRRSLGAIELRFTDNSIGTCSDGEWKRATIIRATGPDIDLIGPPQSNVGFRINGAQIIIDFDADTCDDNTILQGKLSESGASGRVDNFYLFGGEHIGWFTAAPLFKQATPNKSLYWLLLTQSSPWQYVFRQIN